MNNIRYLLLLAAPAILLASGGSGGPTDIIPRAINFTIFAAILYYFVAGAAKQFYFGRKDAIAQKLDSIQMKLRESNSKKEEALQKVGILKNNRLEAVVISTQEYEKLKKLEKFLEYLEHKEIFEVVEQRKKEPKDSYISLEDMAEKFDINLDNL